MKNNMTKELMAGLGVIFLLILLLNPLDFYMPSGITMLVMVSVTISALIFFSFVGFVA